MNLSEQFSDAYSRGQAEVALSYVVGLLEMLDKTKEEVLVISERDELALLVSPQTWAHVMEHVARWRTRLNAANVPEMFFE